MRTKLFLAFITVIIVALVSNLIFERFITRDFEEYVNGVKEDKLYWVLATVEGSYADGRWDEKTLHDAAHWAMMLGFDIVIRDKDGMELVSSRHVMDIVSPSMRRRMEGIVDIDSALGSYETYPLYIEGSEIGTMSVREYGRTGIESRKEVTFMRRGREFLFISFLIAGGGALLTAIMLSLFLTNPLRSMKKAVEALARGDFSIRLRRGSRRDELDRLAESFNFLAEALEREETLRKRLTSNVAHELRTPLTVMKANVEAIMDGVVADREEGLENIRVEVEKLIRLVQGIEDMTKAEAAFFGKRQKTVVSLRSFLQQVIAPHLPVIAEKGLGLRVDADEDLMVSTEADKLEHIVRNILANAVRNTDHGWIRIGFGCKEGCFFIDVADTGRGIAEDRKELIFKRFYRGEDSDGVGIGLSIVKEIVDVMGGRIDLRSAIGEGTVFRVWLPDGDRQGAGTG